MTRYANKLVSALRHSVSQYECTCFIYNAALSPSLFFFSKIYLTKFFVKCYISFRGVSQSLACAKYLNFGMPSLKATIDFFSLLRVYYHLHTDSWIKGFSFWQTWFHIDWAIWVYTGLAWFLFFVVTVQLLMDRLKDPRMVVTVGLGGNNEGITGVN